MHFGLDSLVVALIATLSLFSALGATESFTMASYNIGKLPHHYDYLMAANHADLIQRRYTVEPAEMELVERIQTVALQRFFGNEAESALAEDEWRSQDYDSVLAYYAQSQSDPINPNHHWFELSKNRLMDIFTIGRNARAGKDVAVEIYDPELAHRVATVLGVDELPDGDGRDALLTAKRVDLIKKVLSQDLNQDIVCLQEANLAADHPGVIPEGYEVAFDGLPYSAKGIMWRTDRFSFVEQIQLPHGRGIAARLFDKTTEKTVLVASLHLTAGDSLVVDSNTAADDELSGTLDLFNSLPADARVIGMDSNVTALHPRLQLLKEAGFRLDTRYPYMTSTNPVVLLNTRIDWISADTPVTNIPVSNVHLNDIEGHASDHRPIAARIEY